MLSHIFDWLNLVVRWIHVIVGVAWIGASFYFVWLENHLERNKDSLPKGIAGDLWAIHGGGFYYLTKYKVAPEKLPETLHWFKWEAYATWITGVCLLFIVYYMNAGAYMVDAGVAAISPGMSIAIGIGSLVVGWIFYDVICRTPLLKKPALMLVLMFGFLTFSAWLLSQYLAPRAAYIHVGAMIGTMMAGNVFFVIIPGQKKLVKAAEEGREPDPWDGIYGGLRSRHNNYFTLPVLFIMISNHFPMTYGHPYGWAVLAAISAVSIAIRHHFNVRHKSNATMWVMPAGAVAIALIAWVTSPGFMDADSSAALKDHAPVSFAEAQAVVAKHCYSCHSTSPTDEIFVIAPNGVKFDTTESMVQYADSIKTRVWDVRNMPFGNKSTITEDERLLLAAWVYQGAKAP